MSRLYRLLFTIVLGVATALPSIAEENSSSPEIAVKQVSDQNVRLEPYGIISVPAAGYEWKVEATRPPSFACRRDGSNESIEMVVLGSVGEDEASREAFNRQQKETAVKAFEERGLEIFTVIDETTDAMIKDSIGFEVVALEGDRRIQLAVKHLFRRDKTIAFRSETKAESPLTATFAGTVRFFLADEDAAKQSKSKVPDAARKAIEKEIKVFLKLLEMKTTEDVEKFVRYAMSDAQFEQIKSSGNFGPMSEYVMNETGPILLNSFKAIDWNRAIYTPGNRTIAFPVPPHGIRFTQRGGKWKLRLQ